MNKWNPDSCPECGAEFNHDTQSWDHRTECSQRNKSDVS